MTCFWPMIYTIPVIISCMALRMRLHNTILTSLLCTNTFAFYNSNGCAILKEDFFTCITLNPQAKKLLYFGTFL